MTSDLAARTAAATDLLARADGDEAVPLVVLTDDEECVLGQGTWALSDAGTWRRWCGLGEADRDARSSAAVSALVARGLAVSAADADGLVSTAALGFVQAARSRPGFLVTPLAVGPGDRPLPAPLAYGVVEDFRRVRAVVLELRDGDSHDYRLLSPARAAGALTRWATEVLVSEGTASPVVLEVLRHRAGEELEAAAVTLQPPEEGGTRPAGSTLFFGGRREPHDAEDPGAAAWQLEELMEQAADLPGDRDD